MLNLQFLPEGKCAIYTQDGTKRLTEHFVYLPEFPARVLEDREKAIESSLYQEANAHLQKMVRDQTELLQKIHETCVQAGMMLDALSPLIAIVLNYNGYRLPVMEPQAREELRLLEIAVKQYSTAMQSAPPPKAL